MAEEKKTKEAIQELVIPRYIMRAQLSKKRRKKYFKKLNNKGKPYKRSIPKKYKNGEYVWRNNYLVHKESGEKVVANPRAAGKPKYVAISGNKMLYSTNKWVRNKVIEAVVNHFSEYISQQLRPFELTEFPLRVEWDFHTPVDNPNFDMSNFWFYYKYMEDALRHTEDPLTGKPIIPDDDVRYITFPASPKLIPVPHLNDRMFVFRFYTDDRPEIKENQIWKHTEKEFHLDDSALKDLDL